MDHVEENPMAVKPKRKIDYWLVGILVLAAFLYAWNIWEAGNANDFYTAAITSMTQNFKNFWYASFDPAGFITVDKPPVALWFMAISAKIFGVHGWSVVLPSILFGIGSVYLLYKMVTPKFGPWAGRLAALAMTVTPIVVADSRTNNMDATLVFFLILAVYILQKATSKTKPWLVMVSFGLIGVAFNIKMLQAFMILPAMYLYYWIATKFNWKKKILHLFLATVSLAVFTLIWPLSVDLTNANSRPYEGGSETNSALELAFSYNGAQRLLGQTTGTGGTFPGMGTKSNETGATPPTGGTDGTNSSNGTNGSNNSNGNAGAGKGTTPPSGTKGGTPPTGGQGGTPPSGTGDGQGTTPPSGTTNNASGSAESAPTIPEGNAPTGGKGGQGQGGGMGGAGGGAFNIGTAGPFRVLQLALGSQVGWLLPFALIGLIGAFAYYAEKKRKWYQLSGQQKELVLWTSWLVPVAGFFSIASFFHPYYMIMLAPAISVLFGIGVVALVKLFREKKKSWKTYLLPLAFLSTAALQAWYVNSYYPVATWLILIAAIIVSLILVIAKLSKKAFQAVMTGGLLTILVAPTWWSLTSTIAGASEAIPYADPSLLTSGTQQMGGIGNGTVNEKLLAYLQKNQGDATYLFATLDSGTSAPYIIETGEAVMAIGGFNGTDPAITLKEFKALVKSGEIKYFYTSGKSSSSNKIAAWVAKNAKEVAASKYGGTTTTSANTESANNAQDPQANSAATTSNEAPTNNQTDGANTNSTSQPGQMGGMGNQGGTLYDLSGIYD